MPGMSGYQSLNCWVIIFRVKSSRNQSDLRTFFIVAEQWGTVKQNWPRGPGLVVCDSLTAWALGNSYNSTSPRFGDNILCVSSWPISVRDRSRSVDQCVDAKSKSAVKILKWFINGCHGLDTAIRISQRRNGEHHQSEHWQTGKCQAEL